MNKTVFAVGFCFVFLLVMSSCCDDRAEKPTIGDFVIQILDSNADLPVAGCALAKQNYHMMSSRDRKRVKAIVELLTKSSREDVRNAAMQTLADLQALDKVLYQPTMENS